MTTRPANNPAAIETTASPWGRWLMRSLLVFPALLVMLLGLGVLHPADSTAQSSSGVFTLSLGEVTLMPGQTAARVPVFLDNTAPVTALEMGLDYDEFLLSCVGVDLTESASAALFTSVLTTPANPPLDWVRIVYDTVTPLPPGSQQVVAHLLFEVLAVPQATLELPIGMISSETSVNGTQVGVAGLAGGHVTILVGNTVQIGSAAGSLLNVPPDLSGQWLNGPPGGGHSPVRVPVLLWNEAPIDSLLMGLDYDEFLLLGIEFQGSFLGSLPPGSYLPLLNQTPAGPVCGFVLNGITIPAGQGQVVMHLILLPSLPVAGSYSLTPLPLVSTINGAPIPNLLAGSATYLDTFVRGDASYNGKVTIGDATAIFEHLWQGAPIACMDAADANDDGSVNVADPVFLLGFLFGSGPPPPSPFPVFGDDSASPTADSLDCL